jgi:hypothetical protein
MGRVDEPADLFQALRPVLLELGVEELLRPWCPSVLETGWPKLFLHKGHRLATPFGCGSAALRKFLCKSVTPPPSQVLPSNPAT